MPDLTTADFAFLRHLQAAESCTVSSLYSAFGEDRADYEINRLLSFHLIEAADYDSDFSLNHASAYRLTLAGTDLLDSQRLAEKRRIEERAEQERREKEQAAQCKKDKKQQFRHDFFVAAFGAAVGSIITGIIDHHDEILVFLKELFGK